MKAVNYPTESPSWDVKSFGVHSTVAEADLCKPKRALVTIRIREKVHCAQTRAKTIDYIATIK